MSEKTVQTSAVALLERPNPSAVETIPVSRSGAVGEIVIPSQVAIEYNVQSPSNDSGERHEKEAVTEASVRRMRELADFSTKLGDEMPGYLGMTVYGSTARGGAKPNSDVDAYMFIEVPSSQDGEVENTFRDVSLEYDKIYKMPARFEGDQLQGTYKLPKQAESSIKFLSAMDVIDGGAIDDVDFDVVPLSKDIVADQVSDILAMAEESVHTGRRPQIPVPRNTLGLFLTPVVSDGLAKYQQQVVESIAQSPYADAAWNMLTKDVYFYEQGRDGDYSGNYHRINGQSMPTSIGDALSTYAVA